MKRILTLTLLLPVFALAQNIDLLKNLKFREIGPSTMGGRTDDFAVVESNTNIVYAGTASGGRLEIGEWRHDLEAGV